MTTFENPLTFLRSIKGAPASVLLALLFTRHPMTNRELQRWTGYSADSVTKATQLLVDLGWISTLGPRGPWTLHSGRQLSLMHDAQPQVTDAPPPTLLEAPASSDDAVQEPPASAHAEEEDENFVKTLQTLYDLGIHEPTAGRLARLPHVDPAYVTAHVEQANAQGFHLGIAIYRIEHAWPLPAEDRVLTVEDRIRKFLSGDPGKPHRHHSHGP